MFRKNAFIHHNQRVQLTNNASGRKLLRHINKNHKQTNLAKLLDESTKKTRRLNEELQKSQLDTLSLKNKAVTAVHLAANTAAAKTSLHFREREKTLEQSYNEQQNISIICFLASIARNRQQVDQVDKHLTEIDSLRAQLNKEKERNKALEANHAKMMLEQLRAHHLSLGRSIASGASLVRLATSERPRGTSSNQERNESTLLERLPRLRTGDTTNTKPLLLYNLQLNRHDASVHIQRMSRSFLARKAFRRMMNRQLLVLLQQWGVVTLQRYWRGRLGRFVETRVRWRLQYKKVWSSAHRIQVAWASFVSRKNA